MAGHEVEGMPDDQHWWDDDAVSNPAIMSNVVSPPPIPSQSVPVTCAPHGPPTEQPVDSGPVAVRPGAPVTVNNGSSAYQSGAWGRSTIFRFDGGALTYIGVSVLAILVSVLTLGICVPFGIVLLQRWKATHTILLGRRLKFTGMATHLFGLWLKWWFLMIITLGIYSLWVGPRMVKWIVEHTDYDPDTPPVFLV